jgi:uncharacterized protein
MVSPYGAAEKQLLLEASTLEARAEAIIAMAEYEMASKGGKAASSQLTSDPSAAAAALRQSVDVKTLEMLVCPLTKTRLVLSADGAELISTVARLAFPIREGVPMLSLDEAREVPDDELEQRLPGLHQGDGSG